MKIDFLIPGTPNDAFLSQIAFFRKALDYHGGELGQARVVAVFGDHSQEKIPHRWQNYFKNIEVQWAHPVGADNPMYRAQHFHRYDCIRDDADLAIICDADIAVISPFPELVERITKNRGIYGVIAHFHFPPDTGSPAEQWQELAQSTINKALKIEFNYTLKAPTVLPETPFYVNYGFVAGSPRELKALGRREQKLQETLAKTVHEFFSYQICFTLAVADLDLPYYSLPMRFNFPNDEIADRLYPEELENVHVIHYLRHGQYFDRHTVFASEVTFNDFMQMELTGSNRVFQKFVSEVTGGIYPFPCQTEMS